METLKHTFFIIFLAFGLIFATQTRADEDLIVFSASSMATALEEIADIFETQAGVTIRISGASSSTLARQIKNGAPAHIFISANQLWLSYLWDKRALVPEAPTIATNALVLAGHKSLASHEGQDLETYFDGFEGRIAVAEPTSVPLGIYTKEALDSLRLWDEVSANSAPTRNASSTLNFIETGSVKMGIIYKSDAVMSEKVKILYEFQKASHSAIKYRIAKTKNPHELSDQFIAFLSSPLSQKILTSHGFGEIK